MGVNPYLTFDGDCQDAINHYQALFGGEVVMLQRFGESPMASEYPEIADRIMHFTMNIAGGQIMGSDTAGHSPYVKPQGFRVQVGFNDFEEAKRVFDGLANGGAVGMPFEKTFWAKGFGMVDDKFGVPWMVNCD